MTFLHDLDEKLPGIFVTGIVASMLGSGACDGNAAPACIVVALAIVGALALDVRKEVRRSK